MVSIHNIDNFTFTKICLLKTAIYVYPYTWQALVQKGVLNSITVPQDIMAST